MPKTLTVTGIRKIAERLSTSISHVSYTLDSNPKTLQILRKIVENGTVKIYAYFDNTVVGTIGNIKLIDLDGDIIAQNDKTYIKPQSKGLYVAFKYKLTEMEVDIIDSL